jgi:hypothetical protein
MAEKNIRKLPFALLFLFLAALLFGVNAGEVVSVFEKAVTICLACIGVG